ncbi:MAG: DUF2179 domain-containing protein [Bacilli bacterium]
MQEWIISFLTATPWYVLLLIYASKVIEVSVSTLRLILVNRGYRLLGSILSFFELILWVFVAASVVTDITAAPLKGIVYALGFATGVYIGSMIENWLAFGKVMIQVIASKASGQLIVDYIRGQKLGVTEVTAHGVQGEKVVLMVFSERKAAKALVQDLRNIDPELLVTISDLSGISGGFLPRRSRAMFK